MIATGWNFVGEDFQYFCLHWIWKQCWETPKQFYSRLEMGILRRIYSHEPESTVIVLSRTLQKEKIEHRTVIVAIDGILCFLANSNKEIKWISAEVFLTWIVSTNVNCSLFIHQIFSVSFLIHLPVSLSICWCMFLGSTCFFYSTHVFHVSYEITINCCWNFAN